MKGKLSKDENRNPLSSRKLGTPHIQSGGNWGNVAGTDSLFPWIYLRDRQMDRCFLLGYSLMLKEGDPACSMPIHSTPACDPGITWTIGKCLGLFVLKVCLHLACLVILFEDTEIQGLWSGFHEPESSLAHVEMIWHCWYHPNTVERSVGRVFTWLLIVLRCSIPGAKPMHSRNRTHVIQGFRHILLVTMSSPQPVGGFCVYVFMFLSLPFFLLSVHVFFSFLSL